MNKFSSLKIKSSSLLFLLLFFAFIVRLLPIDFPKFTAEEARIAYRGYSLVTTSKDELGRSHPLLFNSLDDYQPPAVSYITAAGVKVFGKSDFGVRIPFILIGTAVILLIYKIAKYFSPNPSFWLISSFVVALSPPLIFLSKTPNEIIVLTFIFTLLFYLLINNKKLLFTIITIIAAVFISKLAWFILLPFVFFTLHIFQKKLDIQRRLLLIGATALIIIVVVSLFLSVPQAKRSLLENNFSLFNDVTIKNGIDKLRGQGIESGWPALLDRLLFNKTHFLFTGFLHWLSNLNPAIYFGRFDETGLTSLSFIGAFPKILLIPAILGIFSTSVFLYLPLLTFPSLFIYPKLSLELITLTVPFLALVIAFGFMSFNKRVTGIILFLMVFEMIINIYNFSAEYKNTDDARPAWIKAVSIAVFNSSNEYPTAISDNVVSDVVPFINWYTTIDLKNYPSNVRWPYKFRQYSLENIKIIGSDDKFRTCGKDEHRTVFVSKRDLSRIQDVFEVKASKSYQDSLGEDKAYFLSNNLCTN